MNASPADTRSPHLDLEDLIAEVNGQPIADAARQHLASCEHCRAELNRWDLVGEGVRGLAAAVGTPAPAQPGGQRPTRPRVPAGHRRRTVLVASAAAAVVLLGGVGYAASSVIHVTFGTAGTGAKTALTAVSGCASLKMATGTLEQVTGSSLVIRTAGGQPVTVTTTASTLAGLADAPLAEITDGASVIVGGSRSGGTIAATVVTVGPSASTSRGPTGLAAVVRGTVSDASSAGFTIVTSSGSRVPVSTSDGTIVSVRNATLSQMQTGDAIFAIGQAGLDGTLSARAVVAVMGSQLRPGQHISTAARGCSPSAIAAALGA